MFSVYRINKAYQMKKDRIIYWISTGIVCAVMIFSIITFTFFETAIYPEGAFKHLGLPQYFRVEITIAKVLGVLALLIPGISSRIKEFAYFGFGITLLSASIAHFSSGDGIMNIIDPLLFLGVLIVSYLYYHKSGVNNSFIGGVRSFAD